jgi:hypothetical protein
MSFLVKALFIVIAAVLFILVLVYYSSFQKRTIQEKEESNFKMETTNVLQKLVNDADCLAYAHKETPQKIVIDINKLDSFVSSYTDTEPDCAKALGFDYNIKVIQFEKNFTLYPGKTCHQEEVMSNFLCTTNGPDPFVYVTCNYSPQDCQGICQACGEFDNGKYRCDPSWGCGDDPLKNCPYKGSCDQTTCPYGNKPPDGICCIYKLCPRSACEKVISAGVPEDPSDTPCYIGDKCDLSKCTDASGSQIGCAHCTRGIIEVCMPSNELINITIPMQTLGFGVGFGTSGFSPEKARTAELQLSLPITIRRNETFSAEGIIYMYAVKGELEALSSLIEDFCEKAAASSTSMQFSKEFHFSFPVSYSNGKLCMVDSCKLVACPYPIEFDNIDREGDYPMTFSFNPTEGKISVRR